MGKETGNYYLGFRANYLSRDLAGKGMTGLFVGVKSRVWRGFRSFVMIFDQAVVSICNSILSLIAFVLIILICLTALNRKNQKF